MKEENPDGAAVLELEGELSETQAENVRLAQQLGKAQERATELEAAQAKQAAAVDEATTGMRAEIDDLRQRLADRSEQLASTTEALRRATRRAESTEQHDVEREGTIEQER